MDKTTNQIFDDIQEQYEQTDSYINGKIVGYIIGEMTDQQIVSKQRQEEKKIGFEKFLQIKNILDKQIEDIMAIEDRYDYDIEV